MRLVSASLLGVLGLFAASTMACAAPTSDAASDESAAGVDEAEVVSAKQLCSSDAYAKAFSHYKAAVDGAKERLHGDVCNDNAMLYSIANELETAVSTCAQFKTVVATSKWAQPVRDALKGNIALATFDGRLTVKDARGKVVLTGLGQSLPGVTVFGPAPGVYGNMSKLTFSAGGAARLSTLSVDDAGAPKWIDANGTYAVGALNADGTVDLTVTIAGKATIYKVSPEVQGGGYELLLKPKAGGDELRSMPSECEA
jgi:hypothetical protein